MVEYGSKESTIVNIKKILPGDLTNFVVHFPPDHHFRE
jgi:hypothetical protein